MNEKEYTKSRFVDLSRMADEKGISIFSDFLTMAEISDLYDCKNQLRSAFALNGGYEGAERCMAGFAPENMLNEGEKKASGVDFDGMGGGYANANSESGRFPIACIKVSPTQKKFSEPLTHRDYLGSLMNLGVERSKIGDIVINDGEAYVFVTENLADYLAKSLTRVRHTSVNSVIVTNPGEIPHQVLKECVLQVKSERIDAVIAKAYNLSRSQSSELFESGKVFIDGRLTENDTLRLRDDSTISVRGHGKFIYRGISGTSKKGNLYITIEKYE